MKPFCSIPLLLIGSASVALAATIAKFDGAAGDTPWTGNPAGGNPGPSVAVDFGPDGSSALQMTYATGLGAANSVGFNRGDVGATNLVPFSFGFKIGPTAASADGFSFSLLPTSIYGNSGTAPALSEDPAAAGVLGFGFDTWSNNGGFGGFDDPAIPQGSDYNDISLFYNNSMVAFNWNPRVNPGITLDDDLWHSVTGSFDMAGATASLTIDNLAIFTNVPVPGLTPFEYRLGIGARTGGEAENVFLDNISVGVIPEPTSLATAALGFALLIRRRR